MKSNLEKKNLCEKNDCNACDARIETSTKLKCDSFKKHENSLPISDGIVGFLRDSGHECPKVLPSYAKDKIKHIENKFWLKLNSGPKYKEKLTLKDVISYNPQSNPMTKNQEETVTSILSVISPSEPSKSVDSQFTLKLRLKLDEKGNIIIDSDKEQIETSSFGHAATTTSRKHNRWTAEETLKFYKALNEIGTDFSTMVGLIPSRSRNNLKQKFKREEKLNGPLIDRILMKHNFDFSELESKMLKKSIQERKRKSMEDQFDACNSNRPLKKRVRRNDRIPSVLEKLYEDIEYNPEPIKKVPAGISINLQPIIEARMNLLKSCLPICSVLSQNP